MGGASSKPTLSAPPQPVIISQAQIVVPPKPPQIIQQQMPQHHPPSVPVMMMPMRPPPMMRNYNICFALNKFKITFYFTAPQFQMGYMQGMPPQGQPQQLAPAPPVMDQPIPIEDEPPNKKLRSEDHLLAEAQFLALHKVFILHNKQVSNHISLL